MDWPAALPMPDREATPVAKADAAGPPSIRRRQGTRRSTGGPTPSQPSPATRERRGEHAWLLLRSGKRLDLLDPHPMDWDDEDLAAGLARTYRWGGRSRWELPLSVAQHSMTVLALRMTRAGLSPTAPVLSAAECLCELLHDAEEGLLGVELISPLKPYMGDGLREVERRLTRAIARRYRLPDWTHSGYAAHKRADRIAAASEALHVVGWSEDEIRDHLRIRAKPLRSDPVATPVGHRPWEPWPPALAARLFLDMLRALTEQAAAEVAPRVPAAAPRRRVMAHPIRVCVEGGRGDAHVTGEVVDGALDEDGRWNIDGVFTVRTEEGDLVRVNGWCCSTTEVG